jgi:hypothetical protein
MTFPTTKAGKAAAFELMKAKAPALMDDIAELRKQFPGASMTFFKADGLQYGNLAEGHTFTKEWADKVTSEGPTVEQLEIERKEKLRIERAKRAKGKK